MTPDFTPGQLGVLLALMAEAREVRNPDLADLAQKLDAKPRTKMRDMGLISVNTSARPMTLELTDKGWKYCADLMAGEPPERLPGIGKALFTVLAGLHRWMERDDVRPAEVFFPRDTPATITPPPTPPNAVVHRALTPEEVEDRIRSAYTELAREPGARVRLTRLRPVLHDIPRGLVDEALVRLQRRPGVSLMPEENQKTLSGEDRAAAVLVGNQQNHLLTITS